MLFAAIVAHNEVAIGRETGGGSGEGFVFGDLHDNAPAADVAGRFGEDTQNRRAVELAPLVDCGKQPNQDLFEGGLVLFRLR